MALLASRPCQLETPRAFVPLLAPCSFKGARGGRGAAKSHFFAGMLVEEASQIHVRAACVREVQDSIKDSVKQLIEDKINKFGVRPLFRITEREISCAKTDSLIIFKGLQNHTATSIKSLEGFNRAWYEEAQSLSKRSIELAVPTFRDQVGMAKTEQWFSWNPDKDTDPVEEKFAENKGDPGFVCVHVNYPDNPWFPENLRKEMERDKRRDADKYNHIWLGGFRSHTEAAVFSNWKVERFDPPPAGTLLLLGADWGFTVDPTVLVLGFVVGRTLYVWREVWEIGCGYDRRGALFDRIDPEWTPARARDPNWKSLARRYPIIADSAEPATIDHLKNHGFPKIQGAVKGPGSVESGISFLQSYDIVVHPDCKHVERELRLFSFKVDKKTGQVLSELADKDNHTIDSLRYAVESIRRATTSSQTPLGI